MAEPLEVVAVRMPRQLKLALENLDSGPSERNRSERIRAAIEAYLEGKCPKNKPD